jgi:hypothetical protein
MSFPGQAVGTRGFVAHRAPIWTCARCAAVCRQGPNPCRASSVVRRCHLIVPPLRWTAYAITHPAGPRIGPPALRLSDRVQHPRRRVFLARRGRSCVSLSERNSFAARARLQVLASASVTLPVEWRKALLGHARIGDLIDAAFGARRRNRRLRAVARAVIDQRVDVVCVVASTRSITHGRVVHSPAKQERLQQPHRLALRMPRAQLRLKPPEFGRA